MCHLILASPLFALPVFWLMPFGMALSVYLAIVGISAWFLWTIRRAMCKRVDVGLEGLIGSTGKVVRDISSIARHEYLIRSRGELWTARCDATLGIGQPVTITRQNGVGVIIKPLSDLHDSGIGKTGVKKHGRHCH